MHEQDPSLTEIPRHEMENSFRKNEAFIHDSMAVLRMEAALGLSLFPVEMSRAISRWSEENAADSVVMSLEFNDYARNRDDSKLSDIYKASERQATSLKQIYAQFFPEAEL